MTGIVLHLNLAFTIPKLNPMKSLLTIVFLIAICGALHAQDNEKFFGSWDFTTETGAEGYETGVMEISKESVMTTFTDNTNKYPSERVKYEGDTLKFDVYVDGTMVACYLLVKDDSHLTGFAVWDSGETVMNLTRQKE